MGFSTDAFRFFYFWLYMFLYVSFGVFSGQAIAIAAPNELVGQLGVSALTALMTAFSGLLISPNK